MLLKLNDRSEAVKVLQQKLGLVADGSFGPKTQAAVVAFQSKSGLVADGLAGPSTLVKLLGAQPKIDTLTKQDFINAGQILGCHPAMIQAIAKKETHGQANLPDGRPKILFERHQFYKRLPVIRKAGETQASQNALRDRAFAKDSDICNPKAGGYIGGVAEYSRLARARAYSDTAGLECASWGQFQVMGFNAVPTGWTSVQEFVRLMEHGVDQHLLSLVRFIKATPKALTGIRTQNFAMLASAYNGPGYAANKYDIDLKKYFDLYKGQY